MIRRQTAKTLTALVCALVLGAFALSGCAANQTASPSASAGAPAASSAASPVLEGCAVTRDANFGGVCLDTL